MSDLPPWNEPAVRHARGGGVTRTAIGQPLETMERKVLEAAASKGNPTVPSALCQSDCGSQTTGNCGTAKLWGLRYESDPSGSATAARLPDFFASGNAKKGRIL